MHCWARESLPLQSGSTAKVKARRWKWICKMHSFSLAVQLQHVCWCWVRADKRYLQVQRRALHHDWIGSSLRQTWTRLSWFFDCGNNRDSIAREIAKYDSEVLHISSPYHKDAVEQNLLVNIGKNNAYLQLTESSPLEHMHSLFAEEDILVSSYRPLVMERFSLQAENLVEKQFQSVPVMIQPKLICPPCIVKKIWRGGKTSRCAVEMQSQIYSCLAH